ncbi:MAG: amidohydrolase family protein [Candidatus Sabulitectum sp.]|nr:amidohydrolase family protein [Candidatus Sabulitectum sp.]
MRRVSCRHLWTGSSPCLSNTVVHIDDSGVIASIEDCSSDTEFFDHFFAMPSFVDAHTHYSWMVVKEASLDLSGVRSSSELLSLVRSSVISKESGILRGESYDESDWIDKELPSLAMLDSVTADVPVFLRRVCGHAAMVNSRMLQLLESDMPGVNRSTGVLKEWPVMNFDLLFPMPEQVLREASSQVEAMAYSKGVTAVCSFETVHTADSVLKFVKGLDISLAVIAGGLDATSADLPTNVKMIKLFLDGSLGAGNAALIHPYPDGSAGELHYSDQELFSLMTRCGEKGLTVCVHAIGGRALQQLDRVSNRAFRTLGHGFPVRIEHGEDLLNAWPGTWDPEYHIFSMQPNFVERWQRPGGMYDRILSEDRSIMLNPFKTVLDSGFRLGFGSDCMPLDPLYGLMGATRHRNTDESLSMTRALSAYTLDAALISGLDHLSLPLAPGRTADMVFLSGDPFQGLDGVTVEATMKNGRMVSAKNAFTDGEGFL